MTDADSSDTTDSVTVEDDVAAGGADDGDVRDSAVLERVRTEPRPHAAAVAVAVVLGLVLSWLHWMGLVLGGALVGLLAPTLRRAVLGGVAFGGVVLLVFGLALGPSAWVVLETTPVVYLVVAAAVGLPVLGSLLRGVV